jgi:hypothetical protein
LKIKSCFFFVFSIPDVCIERLQEEFNQLDCTDKQKDRMEEFFKAKRAVGELRQDDLVSICELGQGNGGVVWKVRHKPTDKIMARKVCDDEKFFFPLFLLNILDYLFGS